MPSSIAVLLCVEEDDVSTNGGAVTVDGESADNAELPEGWIGIVRAFMQGSGVYAMFGC